MNFDPDELDAIVLGARLVAARGDGDLAEAARRVSTKIGAVLADDAQDRYRRSPLRAVTRASAESAKANRHLGALRSAIRDRAMLRVRYVDLQERESGRIARPLGLTVFDAVWLLTIWCENRSDFRNLRVDRLLSVERTGARFRPESGKRFDDYLETLGRRTDQELRDGRVVASERGVRFRVSAEKWRTRHDSNLRCATAF